MRLSRIQFFSVLSTIFLFSLPLPAAPSVGRIYALHLTDVDGNTLATADGHLTIIVTVKFAATDKARQVGDNVPEYCLGNPAYRLITVVTFEKKHSGPTRSILNALTRRRLDAEGKRLQSRYTAKKIAHNPRQDVFAVLDFDGAVKNDLALADSSEGFHVLVFGRKGELLRHWTEVPTTAQLNSVLK